MYSLDVDAAKKADNVSSRIQQSGKYIGMFEYAEDITSAEKKTKGIKLKFVTHSGERADINIYTVKADGQKIMGFQTLNAIMTWLSLRNITPAKKIMRKWDNEEGKEIDVEALVFQDLHNKEIGLLLESEEYLKNDGSVGIRMNIRAVFQAETELTASEILDRKTEPKILEKMIPTLRHKSISKPKEVEKESNSFANMDDDIPF